MYTTAGIFAALILALVTAVFLLAQLRHDNSLMDIFYGPMYAISYWATWYLTGAPSGTTVWVGGLLTVWALRLGIRIARKNWGQPEDARYAAWRKAWTKRGQLYFILRSYIQVNLLQGLVIFIVATPLWLTLGIVSIPFSWLLVIGFAVALFGLIYETIADWQLDAFIARKKAGMTKTPLMTEGVFRFSRRPNYFGESLVWWGFALIALSNGFDSWFVLISPFVITYILTKVTGPMLEEQFLAHYPEAYQAYQKSTNYFIPGLPRSLKSDRVAMPHAQ